MAANWGRVFSRESSRDYKPVPTQEPFPGSLDTKQPGRARAGSLAQRCAASSPLGDYSRLLTPATPATPAAGSPAPRHTVQIGGVIEVPLTADFLDQDVPSALEKPVDDIFETQEVVAALDNPKSVWSFVEKSWFQAITAAVIMANVIMTIVEIDKPDTTILFFIPDQMMLAFYVVELCLRGKYFGTHFIFGPSRFVCLNSLDITVVLAGVLDQWLMPWLPIGKDTESVSNILRFLRFFRILRAFKIVRVFMDADLRWTEGPAFQSFIGIVILINSLLLGMEIDVPWYGWFYFEQVLLCIYVFELSVRLKHFGRFFFSCDNADIVWNLLDFIIVFSSMLDTWIAPLCFLLKASLTGTSAASHDKEYELSLGKFMLLMRILRLFRILRLAKLVHSVKPLYLLVTGVVAALQGVVWVLVLTIITLYAMGILATSLIGHKMVFHPGAEVPDDALAPFKTVPNSMFVLFRVMSGATSDSEHAAIDELLDDIPIIKLGFVFFMITSSWTLLSILTAVVSDNIILTTNQQEEEVRITTAEEDRMEHLHKLKQLFHTIDVQGDGQVAQQDIEAFLSNHDNAILTAKLCRVPVCDVRDVLSTVEEACEGSTINLVTFVEHLADVSNAVSEKSVMKLAAKLSNLQRVQTEAFVKLNDLFTSWQEKSGNIPESKPEKEVEALCKGQLNEVEKLMQGLVERTERCLSEMQLKSEILSESVAEAVEQAFAKFRVDKLSETLELQLCRMQHELLRSMSGQELHMSKPKYGQEQAALATKKLMLDQELSSTQTSVTLDSTTGSPEALNTGNKEQLDTVNERDADITEAARASGLQLELSTAQTEAQLLAAQEFVQGLQQNAETMLRKNEGFLEKISEVVDQGCLARAVDKLSETVESELRIMREELFSRLGRQSLDISPERDA